MTDIRALPERTASYDAYREAKPFLTIKLKTVATLSIYVLTPKISEKLISNQEAQKYNFASVHDDMTALPTVYIEAKAGLGKGDCLSVREPQWRGSLSLPPPLWRHHCITCICSTI